MSMARVAAPGRSVFRHLVAKPRSAEYESSLVDCPGTCKSAVPDGGARPAQGQRRACNL